MSDFFELMARPLLACVVLSGIHVYLGLHVVQRGVIFVDLALAQVAALGASLSVLFGFALHSGTSYASSLALTLLGAVLLASLRDAAKNVPQEALIGIVYAVAAAGSILVLSVTPEGGEELKNLLVGHLLFVDWTEIGYMAVLYLGVGLLHWKFRKPLFHVSEAPESARAAGVSLRKWDLFFYGSLGIVVTSSVEIAGVLLVFSYLVIPSVCAAMLVRTVRARLMLGWIFGIAGSLLGIIASFLSDLPTGATIVCVLGVFLPGLLLLMGRRSSNQLR